MTRASIIRVLGAAYCLGMQFFTAGAAAAQQSTTTVGTTVAASAPKSGVADGAWSPALTGVRRPPYRLRCSDVVDIEFSFSPELNQSITVQPDGYIALRTAAPLYVLGLTLPELRDEVARAYTGILHDPEITVSLKDFERPYFIAIGEVGRPGKYDLRADITLSEAVAIAGGFTPRARHSQVVLFRRISDTAVESHLLNVKSMLNTGKLQEDPHLQPGDFLYVPQNLLSKIRQFLPTSALSLYANPTQF